MICLQRRPIIHIFFLHQRPKPSCLCFLCIVNVSHLPASAPLFTCASSSVSGPVLETTVGEDANSVLLPNLLSGTEYNVQVTASYPTGQSEPLLVNAKTCRCPQHMHCFFFKSALTA